MYCDVALPLPLQGTFTYSIPAGLEPHLQAGCRVLVPFGARKIYTAIVLHTHNNLQPFTTKEIIELLDTQPTVTPQQLRLWQWIASYYLCPLGDVFKAAMPSGLKLESETLVAANLDFVADKALKPGEQALLDVLATKHTKVSELENATGMANLMPALRNLMQMGAVVIHEEVRRQYKPRQQRFVRLADAYLAPDKLIAAFDELQKRSPRQFQLLNTYFELSDAPLAIQMDNPKLLREVTKSQLMTAAHGVSPSVCDALCAKGIFCTYEQTVGRIASSDAPGEILLNPLSEAQQRAADEIVAQWQSKPVCLLHGVTSSGKTEVYTHLIKQMLDQGKQVLYLLPEIVLTAQLTERLRRIFGARLGVYHSRYPDAERVEVYQKMLSNQPYDILMGVRSSVFLPFQNLGLVIIDEEHEQSFKQQDPAPRYHARNTAIMLAMAQGAHVLLGSATPSIESYHNAKSGKYGLVELFTRFGDVALPNIEVVDTAQERKKRLMQGPFSPRLLEAIGQALDNKQQVILFQNRRGYSPVLECQTCAWTPRCNHCDVSLTFHKHNAQLVCHYCGAVYPVPAKCPACESTELRTQGYGTERIEDLLAAHFPKAKIERMDLDTTRSRRSYEEIIHNFQHGETDILVGTQMVTKGLDFDRVSLVGILSADTMLKQPDFRSHERAFQMMAQVAGRAGRRNTQGTVILQTNNPGLPLITQVVQNDYASFFANQIEERNAFNFPPVCRLIYVYMKHRNEKTVLELSRQLAVLMRQVFGQRVLGPDTPFVSRVQTMYIQKVVLKLEPAASISEARIRLLQIQQHFLQQPQFRAAQIYYDVE